MMEREDKEFRLKIGLRNNRFLKLREKQGMTQKEFADYLFITLNKYALIERLEWNPLDNGIWKSLALNIAITLEAEPDYLWPESIREIKKSSVEMEMKGYELARLANIQDQNPLNRLLEKETGVNLRRALATLTPREQFVLIHRFGLNDEQDKTLKEVGQLLGKDRERIRQIEAKGLRKLRHPTRADILEYGKMKNQ